MRIYYDTITKSITEFSMIITNMEINQYSLIIGKQYDNHDQIIIAGPNYKKFYLWVNYMYN